MQLSFNMGYSTWNLAPHAEAVVGLSETKLRPDGFLNDLSNNTEFKAFTSRAAAEAMSKSPPMHFRTEDISRCIKGLYHTVSKGQHGTSSGIITMSTTSGLVDNDCIAARLFLEFFGVPYALVDSNGNVIPGSVLVAGWTGRSIFSFKPGQNS